MLNNQPMDYTVKKELQLCPNLDLDLKPQKALRQRIKAFKQRQLDDLVNEIRKQGQKNGDKVEAAASGTAGKAANEVGGEDASSVKRENEEIKAAEAKKGMEAIDDTASQ